jgi:hypothetical protein
MKIIKNLLIGLVVIITLLWIGSFAINEKWHMERSISVNAPPSKIYKLTTELKNWDKWSPWTNLDPNTKWFFSDSTFGVGAWYEWKSDNSNVTSHLAIPRSQTQIVTLSSRSPRVQGKRRC